MKNSLILLCAVLFLLACEKENINPISFQQTSPHLTSEKDNISARASEVILNMMKEKGFRETLKKKIMKRFDGDFNILLAELINEEIKTSDNKNLFIAELFRREAKNKHSMSNVFKPSIETRPKDLLDSILSYHPLMQLAIPEIPSASPEDWDAEVELLPIAVSLINEETKSIPLLRSNNVWDDISRLEYPKELVLVVSFNERMTLIPRLNIAMNANTDSALDCLGEPYLVDDMYEYHLTENYIEAQNTCSNVGSTAGGSSGSSNDNNCVRDTNPAYDRIKRIKFERMSSLRETWDNGNIELRLVVHYGMKNNIETLEKTFRGDRGDWRSCGFLWTNCQPKWFETNTELVIWRKPEYGEKMYFRWFENDGDNNVRTEETCYEWTDANGVKIKNCVTETIHEEDDQLGKSFPHYCDDITANGFQYNTGDLSFIISR